MPGTEAGVARLAEALRHRPSLPPAGGLGQRVSNLWQHVFAVQPVPRQSTQQEMKNGR